MHVSSKTLKSSSSERPVFQVSALQQKSCSLLHTESRREVSLNISIDLAKNLGPTIVENHLHMWEKYIQTSIYEASESLARKLVLQLFEVVSKMKWKTFMEKKTTTRKEARQHIGI